MYWQSNGRCLPIFETHGNDGPQAHPRYAKAAKLVHAWAEMHSHAHLSRRRANLSDALFPSMIQFSMMKLKFRM